MAESVKTCFEEPKFQPRGFGWLPSNGDYCLAHFVNQIDNEYFNDDHLVKIV